MKFGFYSCMSGMPWGGSEALWWRAARLLQNEGHHVSVNYKWWPEPAWHLTEIERHGGEVWYRNKPKSFFEQRKAAIKKLFSKNENNGSPASWLEASQPDAVMITLGYHPDQIFAAGECHKMGIPYGINVQCASNFFFIHSDRLDEYRSWYQNATRVYFVSEENQHKVETNIAAKLDNAEIIANPFNVDYHSSPEWPGFDGEYKIACVGRIHFQSKGQDLIVDVMKQDKWKERPIQITFYGHDQGNRRQLEELIAIHGLEDKLVFGGFVEDVQDIWRENHALLLPSRYEGAPLVVIEAMLCNRVTISTNIGRNRELIDDGESGFIAEGSNIELLDRVMERAWEKREHWEQIGELAGQHIRERYPEDPIREFAERIKSLKDLAINAHV